MSNSMTDTPTGTGDLVKRLRGPVQQAAKDLIDAAFNNRDGRGVKFSIPAKPDEDTDLVLVGGIKDAADALEEAERVIAGLNAELDAFWNEPADVKYPDGKMNRVYEQRITTEQMACRDWLARHAIGTRKGGDDDE